MIEERFHNYLRFDSENQELILAALTNPQTKGDFIEKDEEFEFAKHLLIAECNQIRVPIPLVGESNSSNASSQNRGFLLTYNSRRTARIQSMNDDIQIEVNNYLSDNQIDHKVLHKYPLIKSLFFKYNTTLSSSAAVERVFSQSLIIFTPRRNRISADHFEQVLLLKLNRKLIVEKN